MQIWQTSVFSAETEWLVRTGSKAAEYINKMPEISVIIPTYNRAESLKETLKALAAQDLEPDRYEVIVVDDGSADETAHVVARFAAEHPSLHLNFQRHDQNRFRAAAGNTGVKVARGNYLVFTDDDIRPVPGWLTAHLRRHKELDREASVTGLVLYPEEWEQVSNWVRFANGNYRQNETLRISEDGRLPPNRFAGGNTSLRRSLFIAAGMFDEKLRRGQDADLACRLHELNMPLFYEPKAVVYHHAEAIRSIDATLRSFRRYYERDRLITKAKHPRLFELYGHWFLEPVDVARDGMRRRIAKKTVRLLASRMAQRILLRYIRAVDGIGWLYWRRLYQYVMACEALDAIRSSERSRELATAAGSDFEVLN